MKKKIKKNGVIPELVKLKNGLEVILVKMKETKAVTFYLTARVGLSYERKEENGLSHFLEHMMFKGTKKRPSSKILSETMDRLGGYYNAFTSKFKTVYYAKAAAGNLPLLIDFGADIYKNSLFRTKDIEKERGVIIEEVNRREDDPSYKVFDSLDDLIFGDQPAGRAIIGTKENIKAFSRKDLVDWRRRHYSAKNTLAILAGNFDRTKALRLLNKELADLPTGQMSEDIDFSGYSKGKKISFIKKKIEQVHLAIGCPTFDFKDKRRPALAYLASILGEGASSRLFLNIREKMGLAYSVHAGRTYFNSGGYFYVYAAVAPDKAKLAIEGIKKELIKISKKTPDENEFEKVREMIRNDFLLSLETPNSWANFFSNNYLDWGRFWTVDEVLKEIDSVRPADIKKLAAELFRLENFCLALVGPFKEKNLTGFEKLIDKW